MSEAIPWEEAIPSPPPAKTKRQPRFRPPKATVREFYPTKEQRDQIQVLVFLGTQDRIIADMMGCQLDGLRKRCGYELKNGGDIIKAKLGLKIVQRAISGDKGALGALARKLMPDRDPPPPPPQQKKLRNEERDDGDDDPIDFNRLSTEEILGLLKSETT